MGSRGTLLKFIAFSLACLGFSGWLVITLGQISFEDRTNYAGEFRDAQGLLVNDAVKISGVTVGRVAAIDVLPGGTAEVEFSLNDGIELPRDSDLTVRWRNLIGLRFLYIEPGPEGEPVDPGFTFPTAQTRGPADLSSLLNRLTPLIDSLDPRLQNQVIQSLSEALVGREQEVRSLLAEGAELTSTIASRDTEIRSLLSNSATILDAYASREQQLRDLLDSFSEVAATVSERNDVLDEAIIELADGQRELRRFVDTNRDDITGTVDALEDLTNALSTDREGLEQTLATLPRGIVGYHLISRIGQWFNVRGVGVSSDGTILSTERGAAYPRPDDSEDTGTGAGALDQLLGGDL